MRIRLAVENGEIISGAEVLMEAIVDFDFETGWLLAACMISMKYGSSLIEVFNPTDKPVTVYKSTKLVSYLEDKQKLIVNVIFKNQY